MKPASRQPCTGLICNEVEEGYSEDGGGNLVEAARQKKTAPSEKEDVQAGSGADHSSGNGKSKGNSGHKRVLFILFKIWFKYRYFEISSSLKVVRWKKCLCVILNIQQK